MVEWRDLDMAEKKVVYFGKINITSRHVYDIYKAESNVYKILLPVLININDGLEYVYSYTYMYDDKIIEEKIQYTLRIREKTDTYIYGYLSKKGKIPYKQENMSGELVPGYIDNTERIEFYYDVFKEKIGYFL